MQDYLNKHAMISIDHASFGSQIQTTPVNQSIHVQQINHCSNNDVLEFLQNINIKVIDLDGQCFCYKFNTNAIIIQ